MRFPLICLLAFAAPLAAQSSTKPSDTWNWSGTLRTGTTLTVRNINGRIRTEAGGATVEVRAVKRATRGSVDAVEIRVDEQSDGVTICALWPSRQRGTTGCRGDDNTPRRDRDSWKSEDQVEVEFVVKVPAGVRFEASTVNGDIDAVGLGSDATVTTVNGSVLVEAGGSATASTVNGGVRATFGRADWNGRLRLATVNGDVTVSLPRDAAFGVEASTLNGDIVSDFPVTVSGRLRKQSLRGRVGEPGSRQLDLTTVNGGIRLERR